MLGLCEHRSRRVRRFAGTQHFYDSYITLLAAADTIEHRAAEVMYNRLVASATSTDGDTSALESVAHIFGVDWIPSGKLGDSLG